MTAAPRVLVAGAGLAGLSAAVRLVEKGREVVLIEQRRHLGGRAHSFADPRTGDETDNGQHLFLSAYRETLSFLGIVGTADKVKFQERLQVRYRDPVHGPVELACPNWPAPLHLLAGALRLGNLTWKDKWALLRAGPALLRLKKGTPASLDQVTAAEWLASLGQTPALRRAVWDPIIVATLNESPERASAYLLGEVLRRGFLESRRLSYLGYATVGLSDLYVGPARRWLESRGARIETGVPVSGVDVSSGRVRGLTLQSGAELSADAYVLALSPQGLSRLLRMPPLRADPFFTRAGRIEAAPIVSVNLWLDRPLALEAPFVGLLDSPIQWVFDRDRIFGRAGEVPQGRHNYALVTSAARELLGESNARIAELATQAIRTAFPEARSAAVLHSSVVKEPHATFSAVPGFEQLRCSQKTPIENLFLAGDWTDTKLPATIESAVESGRLAAEAVNEYFSRL